MDNLHAATTAAFADAWAGGIAATVLLAPAAASFDRFDSFARGDAFTGIAQKLAASMSGTGRRRTCLTFRPFACWYLVVDR